jgi:hypothetical protein
MLRLLILLLALVPALSHAQLVCGPHECCTSNCPQSDTFFVGELTEVVQGAHFLLFTDAIPGVPLMPGGGPVPFEELAADVQFDGITPGTVVKLALVVKFKASTAKFTVNGQGFCVTVSTLNWHDPSENVLVQGRDLELNRPKFVCRDPAHGTILCFDVRGDVKGPFPGQPALDRLEQVCAVIA